MIKSISNVLEIATKSLKLHGIENPSGDARKLLSHLLSVSKGPERNAGREIIHLENQNLNLKPNDSLLNFIQRLRDEAHRFAITAHRSRRSKASIKSIFDDIKGIGPKRKKDLLLHFGTIQKIRSASLDELKQVKTIPSKKLEELYEFFNG